APRALLRAADGAPRDPPAAAAAATAAATAAAAAAAAAAVATSSAAAPGTTLFSDVDPQGAAIQIPSIEGSDRCLGFGRRRHLDEPKPPPTPGLPVSDELDLRDMAAVLLEGRAKCRLGRVE